MQDRQYGAVARGVQKFVRVPTCRERAGFGLTIADHTSDEQVWIVECRAVGMRERVAEFATFVNGARGFRRDVARNPARKRELLEKTLKTSLSLRNLTIDLAVSSLKVRVGHERGAAMTWSCNVNHVQIVLLNQAVQMNVDEIESGRRSPVTEQARFDVFQAERL